MENVTPVARSDIAPRFLQWSPIVLGAFAATALSSVLLTFAVTIGLGVTSTAPTWRDASAALAILSGLYLIIQAVVKLWPWWLHRRTYPYLDRPGCGGGNRAR